MKKFGKLSLFLATVLVMLALGQMSLQAQCAMCRSSLANSREASHWGQGLNRGILLLAGTPFLAFGAVALLIRQQARNRSERQE